jgi:hypothetical protein
MKPSKKEPAMKRLIGLALVGTLSLVLAAPAHADGGRGSGFQGGQGGLHGTGSRPGGGSQHHGGFQHNGGLQHRGSFQHRGNFYRGCCWGGAFVGWPAWTSVLAAPYYSYPYSYPVYPDPVYVPTPAYQPQPQLYLAPPVQSEMCYIGGCYRLQGDGVSAAFQWVWIPAVPPPPPPPPTAPPAATPAPGALAPTDPGSPRPIQQLYRWVDEQGVANWTNNRGAVPEQYRAQLKQSL